MDIKKSVQGQVAINPNAKNSMEFFGSSVIKKTERLGTALYLVTNFFPNNEPLRTRLRELSVSLIKDASCVRYGTIDKEANVLENLQVVIREILMFLEIAFIAGLISEMNFSILKREYLSLSGSVEVKKVSKESRTDNLFGSSFFGSTFGEERRTFPRNTYLENFPSNTQTEDQLGKSVRPAISNKGHNKGHQEDQFMSDTSPATPANTQNERRLFVNQKSSQGHNNSVIDEKEKVFVKADDITKDSRRARIIKLIKDNKEVTIKDITFYFPELSEKTIQRELVFLVEANVLKKVGERRWSRYSLI